MGIIKKIKSQFGKNRAFRGEIYVVASAILWSLFPIFSKLSFASIPPLFTAAFSILIAAVFFSVMITVKKEWGEIGIKSSWADILHATLIVGVIYYSLSFMGIQRTTAGNVSIIALTEVFFSMTILRVWKKESLRKKYIAGSLLILAGAFVVLFPGGRLQLNGGDLLILAAAAIAPAGNFFQQRAREKVGSNMIMFIRSTLSGICILILAFCFEPVPSILNILTSIFFILANGLLLMGFVKIFWLEGIHRIPITKAVALNSVGPVFTLLFAFLIIGEVPSVWQLMGFLPMLAGIFLLTEFSLFGKDR
jgi:drug/metabolite transporter (DMT)-like permease